MGRKIRGVRRNLFHTYLVWSVYASKLKSIGANSIIVVNSVVTKNIPANCVAAGSPAKIIRNGLKIKRYIIKKINRWSLEINGK